MKISIIVAHPKLDSFNHAIAKRAREVLEEIGHEVMLHDLYGENFNPVLAAGEDKLPEEQLPLEIRDYINEIRIVDGLIFVHPNWWGGPPAILRGWIDRVFRQGSVYKFTPTGPVSSIGDKVVQVFSTSNTPREIELNVYKDPVENFWKVVVFGLLGARSFDRRNFESVILSTHEQRTDWLNEVCNILQQGAFGN